MLSVNEKNISHIAIFGSLGLAFMATASSLSVAQAPASDPIAFVGHGALFDAKGGQIQPSAAFIAKALAWYRNKLLHDVDAKSRDEFASFEKRLKSGLRLSGQAQLVVEQRAIDWLAARSPKLRDDERLGSKLNAIRYQLTWNLPGETRVGAKRIGIWDGGPFQLDPAIERKLNLPVFKPGGAVVFLSTTNTGQAYINECAANQVPIPPTINEMDPNGTSGWKIQGSIPQGQQFIVQSPAEVRTFESPQGMCIALPRFNAGKTTVALDGVICLSKITSKVCIWDNQKSGAAFSFPANQKIPIGVPNLAIDPMGRYQGGGAELSGPVGGICTDCHAGENPYIVHPDAVLAPGLTFGQLENTLPMFAPNRYDPLVLAAWPQNAASHAGALVPGQCSGCHSKGLNGRFPHLSNQLPAYCALILKGAVQGLTIGTDGVNAPATMPQGAPGSAAGNAAVNTFRAFCNDPPDANAADWGDPHLTTVNGINYDFQSAGEFTALRNLDSEFELQTRQTPVVTSFVPGTNPYTGLQSCVSLNTAAALRLGKRRVSYQPGSGTGERMEIRIDGKLVNLPAGGINLGGGNRIATAAAGGGILVNASDGTRVAITPNFWSSQGHWYLNVDVLKTPAREGTMGYIQAGNWLPLAPDGSSFGPRPVPLMARWTVLNQKFADAWRVKPTASLFDYASGTSTGTFTDPSWPAKPGGACSAAPSVPSIPSPGRPTIRPLDKQVAAQACRPVIKDEAVYQACLFDATVMGDAAVGEAYRRTLAARAAAKLP